MIRTGMMMLRWDDARRDCECGFEGCLRPSGEGSQQDAGWWFCLAFALDCLRWREVFCCTMSGL
jgi:hypothetical protein